MRALLAALLLAVCGPAFALHVTDFSLTVGGQLFAAGRITVASNDVAGKTFAASSRQLDAVIEVTAPYGQGDLRMSTADRENVYVLGEHRGTVTFDQAGILESFTMSGGNARWGYCCWPWSWSSWHNAITIRSDRTFSYSSSMRFDPSPETPGDPSYQEFIDVAADGQVAWVRPSPAPEPTTYAMLAIGLALITWHQRPRGSGGTWRQAFASLFSTLHASRVASRHS